VPPSANPRFHPKYIPEMTYPTPNPHNIKGPSVRDNCGEEGVSFGLLLDILKDKEIIISAPVPVGPLPFPSIDRPIQINLQIDNKLLRSYQHL
jgi:hypothetical protein